MIALVAAGPFSFLVFVRGSRVELPPPLISAEVQLDHLHFSDGCPTMMCMGLPSSFFSSGKCRRRPCVASAFFASFSSLFPVCHCGRRPPLFLPFLLFDRRVKSISLNAFSIRVPLAVGVPDGVISFFLFFFWTGAVGRQVYDSQVWGGRRLFFSPVSCVVASHVHRDF